MRLLNFYTAKKEKAMGLVERDQVFNLTSAADGRPEFASVGAWLRAGEAAWEQAQRLRDRLMETSAATVPLAGLSHAPLVEPDARVFCGGLNYADHAAENNLPPPSSPIFFSKLAAVILPHQSHIPIPAISTQVDYEAEFALVLGRRANRVTEAEARGCIAGFTIMNDVTARDLQVKDKQWFRSKNCNGFGPMGPWMVTAESVPDPLNLEITLRVNGETRQHSNTRNLIFSPERLVSVLSQTLALESGDIISTGTPSGIGFHRKPQVFLNPGDRIEVEVSGIGILENLMVKQQIE